MVAEFEDPALAPVHARKIGRPQFLRWGLMTAGMGAISSNLNAILAALGASRVPLGLSQPAAAGDGDFLLYLIGNSAPACVFLGSGLALAATTEVRRAVKNRPGGRFGSDSGRLGDLGAAGPGRFGDRFSRRNPLKIRNLVTYCCPTDGPILAVIQGTH